MAMVPDFLVDRIISLLENEVSLLGGIHDELEEIKRELVSMRSFLEDADTKGARSEGDKTWVANVRDIAYDVEDIIDEFMYHVNRKRGFGRYKSFLYETICFPKDLWVKHQFASKLQRIKTRIEAIPERRLRYDINNVTTPQSNQRWVQSLAESSLFLKDDDLVGIEDEMQLLVGWLTDGVPQRTTTSVFGMGGSGKTTLVAKTYKSEAIERHFHCYAWITVSQSFIIEELFRAMIKEFFVAAKDEVPMDLGTMSYRQLVETLVNYLQPKRYVVVLDDVWDINLWRQINVALPDGMQGSRVILTTRKEDIASFSFGVGSHVHRHLPLGKNEAWALFCMKAFSSNPNRCCPIALEHLARGLVEKCEGLPLAIVALGGLMSSKTLETEWRKVYNSLHWELSNNSTLEGVKSILLLSFDDLPYRLKHCFLYCCIFPEDYLIRRKRLIRLWVAEGFIEQFRGLAPEEVAESYLMELILRSMLQVVERNPSGRPKACKLHDLMREIALSISEKERFCVVHDGREVTEEGGARRLSIQGSDKELKLCKEGHLIKRLRSMTQLRRIEITKVREADGENLCMSIECMGLLRYLSVLATNETELLRMDALKSAPPCLQKLVVGGKLEKVPRWFYSLQSLTFLHLHWSRLTEDLLPYIQALPNLGDLKLVNAYEGKQLFFLEGFPKLTYLRLRRFPQLNEIVIGRRAMPGLQKLSLIKCPELKTLPKGIEDLTCLQELYLSDVQEEVVERIRGEGSVDRSKVQHIPKINHYYQTQEGMFHESLS